MSGIEPSAEDPERPPGAPEDWHYIPLDSVFEALSTDESGLSEAEATARLDEYGPNEIREGESVSPVELSSTSSGPSSSTSSSSPS